MHGSLGVTARRSSDGKTIRAPSRETLQEPFIRLHYAGAAYHDFSSDRERWPSALRQPDNTMASRTQRAVPWSNAISLLEAKKLRNEFGRERLEIVPGVSASQTWNRSAICQKQVEDIEESYKRSRRASCGFLLSWSVRPLNGVTTEPDVRLERIFKPDSLRSPFGPRSHKR